MFHDRGKSLRLSVSSVLRIAFLRRFHGASIGRGVRLHSSAKIICTPTSNLIIEDDVVIDEEAVVSASDSVDNETSTRIGARSYIGIRAMVQPGVQIGKDCVIYPGTVVASDLPDCSSAFGNPAIVGSDRIIRTTFFEINVH